MCAQTLSQNRPASQPWLICLHEWTRRAEEAGPYQGGSILHIPAKALFTVLTAGFVNFSNRISSLLFITLAFTSSSRIDKSIPWVLSWQRNPLMDGSEQGTHFPGLRPWWPLPWHMWECLWQWCQRCVVAMVGAPAGCPQATYAVSEDDPKQMACPAPPSVCAVGFRGCCSVVPASIPHLPPWLLGPQPNKSSPLDGGDAALWGAAI